jgi:ABC-type uncharacterized transport system permease subunit
VAVNIIAVGMTAVLGIAWFAQGGQTPAVTPEVRLQAVLPVAPRAGSRHPGAGIDLGDGLLSHNIMVYATLALVPAVWWLLYRTRFGLRLRAVGENAAHGGCRRRVGHAHALCGAHAQRPAVRAGRQLPGAGAERRFVPNMTAGRGFMALAAMIFGKWHPVGAFWACLLFGFLDAVAIRLQGVALPGIGEVPVQAIQACPTC